MSFLFANIIKEACLEIAKDHKIDKINFSLFGYNPVYIGDDKLDRKDFSGIDKRDVSNVVKMDLIFTNASSFRQNIDDWKVKDFEENDLFFYVSIF